MVWQRGQDGVPMGGGRGMSGRDGARRETSSLCWSAERGGPWTLGRGGRREVSLWHGLLWRVGRDKRLADMAFRRKGQYDKAVTLSWLWYESVTEQRPVERWLLCCESIAWDLPR